MREWCQREDFRAVLGYHLQGEDEAFTQHIQGIAKQETSLSIRLNSEGKARLVDKVSI